jgi:hypothetical protein
VISIDDESISVGSSSRRASVFDVDNMDVDVDPSCTPSASISARPGPSTSARPHSPSASSVYPTEIHIPEGLAPAEKREKRYNVVVDPSGKKKKVVDIASFHEDVRKDAEAMKKLVERATWEKGKFPTHLKAPLVDMAIRAIKLDEYDDHFFNLLPTIFPYNRFTMTKLTKRQVFPQHLELLQEAQETLLALLAKETKEGLPKAKEEYDKAKAAWGLYFQHSSPFPSLPPFLRLAFHLTECKRVTVLILPVFPLLV